MSDWLHEAQIAEHEAAHEIAAREMGLPVAWVTVHPGCDEGISFTAAVKIPDELIDRERDLFAICVATAAPYHLLTHRTSDIGKAARLEYMLATEMAGRAGITAEEVYDRSAEIVDECWPEIVALALRLQDEGTVTFDTVPA